MRWVIGIVVVAVLALLGYQYFGDRVTEVAEQPGVTEQGANVADQAAEEAEQAADQAATATEEAATATEQAAEEAATATEEAGEQAAETAEQAGQAAQGAAEQAQESAEQAGQAAQGAAQQAEQATEQAAEATQEAAQGAADTAAGAAAGAEETLTEAQTAALTVGDVNVGEQLTDVMQNTEEALQGVTDAASAKAAVPKLNDINTQLEKISGTVDQLPADAKKVLADVLGERVTELRDSGGQTRRPSRGGRRREAGARADHCEAGGLGAGASLARLAPDHPRAGRREGLRGRHLARQGGAFAFLQGRILQRCGLICPRA